MRLSRLAAAVLFAIGLLALGADLVAPYGFAAQHRDAPFSPPTRIRFVDAEGNFHWRPFVYRSVFVGPDRYLDDTGEIYSVRLFVESPPHEMMGLWRVEKRLFGVDPPARLFLLGSDEFGRDVFSRLAYGARVSLLAGLLAGLVAVTLGSILGTAAGYYGRWADSLLMRASELFLALPWLYLLFGVRAVLPLDLAPVPAFLVFVAIIAAIGWAHPARLFRGLAASAVERDFVVAARSFGAGDSHLVRHHLLPSSFGLARTQLAILFPRFVLAEVSLSFLGLGMADPVPTLGTMLAVLQRPQVVASSWWLATPAIVLLLVVLSAQRLESADGGAEAGARY